MCCDGGWKAVPETSRHGDCAQVKIFCGESEDEEDTVGPAHREVAGEGPEEALVKLSLDESNEGGRHVLLYHCLCYET